MSDITAMYNQIKIPSSDRDDLRFLWLEDDSIVHYRMTSHLFGGVWCSSSSSYALRKTADLTSHPMLKNIIKSSFYVDDLMWSTNCIEDATDLMPQLKSLLAQRGFHLNKFIATHEDMLSDISPDARLRGEDQMLLCHSDKALGVGWCLRTDTLYIRHKLRAVSNKSEMLSALASVYDPLGLISPLHLHGKLLFQQACRLRLSWEDQLPLELLHQWDLWVNSMNGIPDFVTRRCMILKDFDDAHTELHCFSDASQSAYGACIYLRCINKTGKICISLVCSKSRVCPMRPSTIPRLELQAAVLSVRLESSVRAAISLAGLTSTFWCDSEITLAYIKNESKRFHTYVSNRVTAIRSLSNPSQWHHVPGGDNPADLVSRGVHLKNINKKFWQEGPSFLRCHKSTWSVHDTSHIDITDIDVEVKKSVIPVLCASVSTHTIGMICEYLSSWNKVKLGCLVIQSEGIP